MFPLVPLDVSLASAAPRSQGSGDLRGRLRTGGTGAMSGGRDTRHAPRCRPQPPRQESGLLSRIRESVLGSMTRREPAFRVAEAGAGRPLRRATARWPWLETGGTTTTPVSMPPIQTWFSRSVGPQPRSDSRVDVWSAPGGSSAQPSVKRSASPTPRASRGTGLLCSPAPPPSMNAWGYLLGVRHWWAVAAPAFPQRANRRRPRQP